MLLIDAMVKISGKYLCKSLLLLKWQLWQLYGKGWVGGGTLLESVNFQKRKGVGFKRRV